MSAESPGPVPEGAIPADEYQRGVNTQNFIDEMASVEKDLNRMTGDTWVHKSEDGAVSISRMDRLPKYSRGEWPSDRAQNVADKLSKVPGSGIDTEAAAKVRALKDEAYRMNEAHDVVTSGGADTKFLNDEQRRQRVLGGNNQVGPSFDANSQFYGSMVRAAGRKYDIKNGVAMRGVAPSRPDPHGNFGLSSGEGEYVPFAPQHQEAAKKAMQSLAEKKMDRSDELRRQEAVRAAKEVLGRRGIKIPKTKEETPPQGPDLEQAD